MKSRRRIFTVAILTVAAAGVIVFFFLRKNAEYIDGVDPAKVHAAYELLSASLRTKQKSYADFLKETTLPYGKENIAAYPLKGSPSEGYEGKTVEINYNETVEYLVDVKESGLFNLVLDYRPVGNTLANFIVDVKINDSQDYVEMNNIELPLRWRDRTKDFPVDRYGDEVAPEQVRIEEWTSLSLYNTTYNTSKPLLFALREGINRISITNVSNDGLGLGAIKVLVPTDDIPAYEEYRSLHKGDIINTMIRINAVDYIEKNTTQAMYASVNNPALTPHDSEYKLLNTIAWSEAGTQITYKAEVPKDGFYHLAFHYQNTKEEFDVFNSIYIDGRLPFRELGNYPFPSTGNEWANEVLCGADGSPYLIYLTKGIHYITIRSEMEPIEEAWRYARLISEHVTQFELDITKITGAEEDKDRTWKMTKYIPEIPDYLEAYETLIKYIQYSLQNYTPNGINSAILSDLDKVLAYIDKMKEYPDEIALYRSELTGRDDSVLQAISNFSSRLLTQDFSLDMIYVYGDTELPRANATFLKSAVNGIKGLFYTFTSKKYRMDKDPDVLNVWVNRAITHVDLMQKMADTKFTPKTGIKVKISIMPDVYKLTMASAAGKTPDIALGLSSYMPFDLASRGALYDLTKFKDFWIVADRFAPGAFVPYIFNEGVYAIPETADFNAIIYRTDIFESLGLSPPDTWQDVVDMLPVLQRYGMNFYHNISSGVGYKWFYQTSSLIFQYNGKIYTDDGMRTAIDQPNAVKGLQALGNLFISYALDKEVISFYNSFRYNVLPVGIVSLSDYTQIKNAAPELEGQWALAPYPGTVQEDGSISRWFISNGTGGIIFKDTLKAEEAWEFLKWWTDYDTQVEYAYTLQSTYGKQYLWLSSNLEAVAASPIEQKDKAVIVEQLRWLRDVPRTPGQYLVERSISDIWNDMVNDGESAQVAIDERVITINREIRKKMQEIGYCDKDGNLIVPYVIRDIDWVREQIESAKREVN